MTSHRWTPPRTEEDEARQCRAAGRRCTRKTKHESGYCHQHRHLVNQPDLFLEDE